MKRRPFLLGAAALAAVNGLPWPRQLAAQTARRFVVGCLWANDPESIASLERAFVAGLRDAGYEPGRNLILEMRYARGDNRRIPALADELISLKPDVVIGIESVAQVMRSKSTTIPVVLIASPDPVATGLVRSLSRPGTNVTGLAYRLDQLVAKHIDFLAEIAPKMSRVALFNAQTAHDDPGAASAARNEHFAKVAAAGKRLNLLVVRARDADGVREAFAQLERARPAGIVVSATAHTYRLRTHIAQEARRLRLPSISSLPAEWAEAGGLITYGPDWHKNYRYAATFVDRILKGAKPAEMPIEQPEHFELIVNAKTAREIGVTLPSSILFRASRIIG